jgi:hypothetical protein
MLVWQKHKTFHNLVSQELPDGSHLEISYDDDPDMIGDQPGEMGFVLEWFDNKNEPLDIVTKTPTLGECLEAAEVEAVRFIGKELTK